MGKATVIQPLPAGTRIELVEKAILVGGPPTGSSNNSLRARSDPPRLFTSMLIAVTPAAR